MKLYKLSQSLNTGYDTYDSCVVCAKSKKEARLIHPSKFVTHSTEDKWFGTNVKGEVYETENDYYSWVRRKDVGEVEVEYIGEAKKGLKKGVIVNSFNAG